MSVLKLDINSMNDFELKGILVSFIGKARRQELIHIFEVLKPELQVADDDMDNLPYALSDEQEAELMVSLAESYQEENMMPIEDAKKMHARWLKP